MKEPIGVAVIVATIFGGTITAEKIYIDIRQAALTKAAQGLPRLSAFSEALTHREKRKGK